jgi:hypothetical protein
MDAAFEEQTQDTLQLAHLISAGLKNGNVVLLLSKISLHREDV